MFVVDTTASGYDASDPTTWQFVHTTDSTGKVTYVVRNVSFSYKRL